MKFLGIDHSLNKTAIVCLDKNGKYVGKLVYKNKKHKGTKRLFMLLKFFNKLKAKHRYKQLIVGMENYSFGSRGRSVFNIGEAGGIVRLVLTSWVGDKSFYVFAPKSVKKFASGNGNSGKPAMIKAVKTNWKFNAERDHDVADAFAVAQLTRAYHYRKLKKLKLKSYQTEVISKIKVNDEKR